MISHISSRFWHRRSYTDWFHVMSKLYLFLDYMMSIYKTLTMSTCRIMCKHLMHILTRIILNNIYCNRGTRDMWWRKRWCIMVTRCNSDTSLFQYIIVQSKDIFQIISLVRVYRQKALVYNKAHALEHKHPWIIYVVKHYSYLISGMQCYLILVKDVTSWFDVSLRHITKCAKEAEFVKSLQINKVCFTLFIRHTK